jgi:hypothetical protein
MLGTVISAVIMIGLTPLLAYFSAPYLTRQDKEKVLDQQARQVNLALTPEVRPLVIERIVARERAHLVGTIAGIVVGFVLILVLPTTVRRHLATDLLFFPPPLLFAVFGLILGVTVAPVATAAMSLRRRNGTRIARAITPSIDDYVPRSEIWPAAAAAACVAVTLSVGVALVGSHGSTDRGPLLLSHGAMFGYVALAALLIGKLLSRRILQTGQVAASGQELAWDDALRASTLRDLSSRPQLLAAIAQIQLAQSIGDRLDLPALASLTIEMGILGSALVFLLLGLAGQATTPSQHYWRRLWAQPSTGAQ